jgi:hypothetical protein
MELPFGNSVFCLGGETVQSTCITDDVVTLRPFRVGRMTPHCRMSWVHDGKGKDDIFHPQEIDEKYDDAWASP